MQFEKIKAEDIAQIKNLPPDEWGDITPQIELYLKFNFCHSIKVMENDEIIGIGTAILYKNTGWIAHLIVDEKFRNRGIGTQILNYLCEYCMKNGRKTLLLFATESGYPLYKKYGFVIQNEYIQYTKQYNTIQKNYFPSENIRKIGINDHERIFELDKLAIGENRQILLSQFINDGFVYEQNGKVTGFYLQNLGEGLIIADDEEAGMELIKLRITDKKSATVPIGNIAGNKFYKENNFIEFIRIKRMMYGNRIECKDENIYNRIGGNFG